MTSWQIFLIKQIGSIKVCLIVPSTICFIISFVYLKTILNELSICNESNIGLHKLVIKSIFAVVLFTTLICIGVIMPNSKTMGEMFIIPYLTEIESAKEISPQANQIIKDFIKDYLQEENK